MRESTSSEYLVDSCVTIEKTKKPCNLHCLFGFFSWLLGFDSAIPTRPSLKYLAIYSVTLSLSVLMCLCTLRASGSAFLVAYSAISMKPFWWAFGAGLCLLADWLRGQSEPFIVTQTLTLSNHDAGLLAGCARRVQRWRTQPTDA